MKKRPSLSKKINPWSDLKKPSSQPRKQVAARRKVAQSIDVRDDDGVDIDPDFLNLSIRLDYDPSAAIGLLKIINSYLENNDQLPYNIRDHLFRAFSKAIAASERERTNVLGMELGLTKINRRPRKADTDEIGSLVEQNLLQVKNITVARKKVSEMKGLSLRTVGKYHKAYKEDNEIFSKIQRRAKALKKK
jgi:hypothetical protein